MAGSLAAAALAVEARALAGAAASPRGVFWRLCNQTEPGRPDGDCNASFHCSAVLDGDVVDNEVRAVWGAEGARREGKVVDKLGSVVDALVELHCAGRPPLLAPGPLASPVAPEAFSAPPPLPVGSFALGAEGPGHMRSGQIESREVLVSWSTLRRSSLAGRSEKSEDSFEFLVPGPLERVPGRLPPLDAKSPSNASRSPPSKFSKY